MRRFGWFAAALCSSVLPRVAEAQLGEVHLGAVAGYGTGSAARLGAGLVVAVVPGRLAHLGLRVVQHHGRRITSGTEDESVEVTSRARVVTADLGLQFPTGPFELVIGAALGAVQFTQTARGAGPAATTRRAWEFHVAPSVALYARVAGLLVAPEVQYALTGSPDLRWPAAYRGLVIQARLVVPFEIDRIRH